MDSGDARRLALDLPEAAEQDHHGRPSFRIEGRIFATLWTAQELNVMAPEDVIRAAVDASPNVCSLVPWGKRIVAVKVALPHADPAHVEGLLYAAWSSKAPKRLIER